MSWVVRSAMYDILFMLIGLLRWTDKNEDSGWELIE